jgi:hypothetical protein
MYDSLQLKMCYHSDFVFVAAYTLGFVGIGKIGNAVARGYAGADDSVRPAKVGYSLVHVKF